MNIKSPDEKKEIMTDNPCDSCQEDCAGGVIWGNCFRYRNWWRSHNHFVTGINSEISAFQSVLDHFICGDQSYTLKGSEQ